MSSHATTDADAIIREMDREHDEINGVMQRLRTAPHAEIPAIWDGLMAYAREHFRKEELVMSIMDADAQAAHVLDHERMMQRLTDMREVLDHPHLIIGRLTNLLMDWLSDHIDNHDGPLMEALVKRRSTDQAWDIRG